jgi:hypothetical protein
LARGSGAVMATWIVRRRGTIESDERLELYQ